MVAIRHGLSGARIWRLSDDRDSLCLRAWPPSMQDRQRLRWIRHCLRQVGYGGFSKIPIPWETVHSDAMVGWRDRLWELTPWIAGQSIKAPSAAQLGAAVIALAEFHRVAASVSDTTVGRGESPAVKQRATLLSQLRQGGWQQLEAALRGATASDIVKMRLVPLGTKLLGICRELAPPLTRPLEELAREALILQLCHGDIHSEHVLFNDDAVSGFIDFGNLRIDSPLTDLARMLGSYAVEDERNWQRGVALCVPYYHLTARELHYLDLLDEVGLVLAAANWLRWIFVDHRQFPFSQVQERLKMIQRRLTRRR